MLGGRAEGVRAQSWGSVLRPHFLPQGIFPTQRLLLAPRLSKSHRQPGPHPSGTDVWVSAIENAALRTPRGGDSPEITGHVRVVFPVGGVD